MRFPTVQFIALTLFGLTKAQTCCRRASIADFEGLPNVPSLGLGSGGAPIPYGYSGLNWTGLNAVSPSIAAQFLLPQGKVFAVTTNPPATTPVIISALKEVQDPAFKPESIFIGTFQRSMLGGIAALSSPSTINITATFPDETTAETSFKFNPANTLFGLPLNAEPLQYFKFPCGWYPVMSLKITAQADNGANAALALAIDNFQAYLGAWDDGAGPYYC